MRPFGGGGGGVVAQGRKAVRGGEVFVAPARLGRALASPPWFALLFLPRCLPAGMRWRGMGGGVGGVPGSYLSGSRGAMSKGRRGGAVAHLGPVAVGVAGGRGGSFAPVLGLPAGGGGGTRGCVEYLPVGSWGTLPGPMRPVGMVGG